MQLLRGDGARLERRLARVRQVRTVRRTSAPDSSKAQASLSKAPWLSAHTVALGLSRFFSLEKKIPHVYLGTFL